VGENYLFFNKIETLDIFHDFFNISNLINFNSNIYFGSIFKKEIFLFKNITPIILASGFSKRFNGNKLNTKLKNGFSILEQTLKNLNSIYFKEKLLIGKDYFFKNLSLKYNFTYIDNKLSQKGQSQSIISGVKNSSQEGFLFIPGDMPFLTYKTLIKIIFSFEETNEIIVPIINEQPSAPVLFPKCYTEKLLKLTGDTGGRNIFKTNKHIKCYFYNSKEFLDIDTQEELTRLETLED
ncbi:NTP transferase domain-containing protein, partial [uncultured Cetobacterium sp.]